jgi:hypothetical protein
MNETNNAPLRELPATELVASAGLDVWTAPTAAITRIADAQHAHTGPNNDFTDAYYYCVAS